MSDFLGKIVFYTGNVIIGILIVVFGYFSFVAIDFIKNVLLHNPL
jgi:hypothetical protein